MATVDLPDEAITLISQVAAEKAADYNAYVERSDIYQELWVAYHRHYRLWEKWRAEDQPGPFRLIRALHGTAKKFCETEKAHAAGYEPGDVFWYDATKVAALIPFAFNSGWDGLTGAADDPGQPHGKQVLSEGGNLVAMVMDVRRALKGLKMMESDFDPDSEVGAANLRWVCQRLGGTFEHQVEAEWTIGRRPVLSNAQAGAITGTEY